MVSISGLDGYVYILAKRQTVSFAVVAIMNEFVQALNFYTRLEFTCAHESLSLLKQLK